MKTPIDSTEPSPTTTPSTTSERAPMKQLSSMMVGFGLQRLEHAADADAAREVAVLADLRAGADRRPGVDHRALVDIGAEIDEGRHQHDARRDIGRVADDAVRHGAEAGLPRTPAAPQPSNFDGTLSHQDGSPGPPLITAIGLSRNESSTAFLSHWLTVQPSAPFSATRTLPWSSSASASLDRGAHRAGGRRRRCRRDPRRRRRWSSEAAAIRSLRSSASDLRRP